MTTRPGLLLVDDYEGEGEETARFLRSEGYEVRRVTTQQEALDALRGEEIQCAVTYARVVDGEGTALLGGISVLEAIDREYPDLPVILFSGLHSDDLARLALERDAFDFVPRREGTGSHERLLRRIESALTRVETRRRATKQTRINEAVRYAHEALVQATSRDEIESRVPAELIRSRRYVSACIADVGDDGGVRVRSQATTTDDAGPRPRLAYPGPLARAGRQQRPVVEELDGIGPDSVGLEHGHETVLAVPVTYEGHNYGVLAVYTDRPNPFEVDERETLGDVADNVAMAIDAVETKLELQERNERLERFAKIISHELRNPLQTAMARLELLREKGDLQQAEIVARNHDRMERLVNDLVDLVRRGERTYEIREVVVADCAEQAWQTIIPPDATLQGDAAIRIRADPDRLTQLFENCFLAAVRMGGQDVTVEVGRLTGMDGFYVRYDGEEGVERDPDDLFSYKYENSDEGRGVGLRIVEEIVDTHGWTIEVEDRDAGGMEFRITGVTII